MYPPCSKRGTNTLHLIIRKLLSWIVSIPFFINHILHVLRISAKPKMVWIYAKRNIARMAYAHAFWYFSLKYRIRCPVCEVCFSSVFYLPIRSIILSGVNNASVVFLFHAIKQSLLNGFQKWRVSFFEFFRGTISTAKLLFCSYRWRCYQYKIGFTMDAMKIKCSHFVIVSHIHNGGLNGYDDRLARYEAALSVLA